MGKRNTFIRGARRGLGRFGTVKPEYAPCTARLILDGLTRNDERFVRRMIAREHVDIQVGDAHSWLEDADERGRTPYSSPLLVIAGPYAIGRLGSTRIEVGAHGQFRLPEDEDLLRAILREHAGQPREETEATALSSTHPSRPCICVAGWNGGVGTSSIAHQLAHERGLVLIDASGHAPAPSCADLPENRGVRWADLAYGEVAYSPELARTLPIVQGVSVLAGDGLGVATPLDSRLGAVISSLNEAGHGCVVDCGRWEERSAACVGAHASALVLIGRADRQGATQCACSLTLWPLQSCLPCVLLTTTGNSGNIRALTNAPVLTLKRAIQAHCRRLFHELGIDEGAL